MVGRSVGCWLAVGVGVGDPLGLPGGGSVLSVVVLRSLVAVIWVAVI